MKKILVLVMLLLFAQQVCAEKIMVLNLNYKEGQISIIDKVEKYGYYPDRKLQPDAGYRAEIVSVDDEPLYSFNFEIPLEHYTDIEVENKTQGGLIIVDEIDFALILPSLPNAKEINFYNEAGENILAVDIEEKKKEFNP